MATKWIEITVAEKFGFIHNKVSVMTADRKEITGWVYTVDPVTHSIVLVVNNSLTTILGHSVALVSVLDTPTNEKKEELNNLLVKELQPCDAKSLEDKRNKLVSWIQKNRFPVEIVNERISVAKTLDILPPYDINSCEAANEIILSRIQKLIETMPDT